MKKATSLSGLHAAIGGYVFLIFYRPLPNLWTRSAWPYASNWMRRGISMVLAEDSYKELLDNFLNGIYFVDTDRRITYWNKGAERISGYTASEVVGHKCSDNILIHVDEQGRQLCMIDCPVAHTLDDQRVREAAVFLHHKAGHCVPVAVQVIPIRDASSLVIGAAEVFQDNSARFADRETIGRLQKAALIDHLTGLPNRRYLEMKLQTCLDDLKRYRFPFGIIFADIDHFKGINDTIGHPMGDEVYPYPGGEYPFLRPFRPVGRGGVRCSDPAPQRGVSRGCGEQVEGPGGRVQPLSGRGDSPGYHDFGCHPCQAGRYHGIDPGTGG